MNPQRKPLCGHCPLHLTFIITITAIISVQHVESVERLPGASYEFKSRTTTQVPATFTWIPKENEFDQPMAIEREDDDDQLIASSTERVLTTAAFDSVPKFKFHGDKKSERLTRPDHHVREARYYLHNLLQQWNATSSIAKNFVIHRRPVKLKRHQRSTDYDQELIQRDDFIIGRPRRDQTQGDASEQKDNFEQQGDHVNNPVPGYKVHSPLIKRIEIGQKPVVVDNGPFIEVPVRNSRPPYTQSHNQQPSESQRHEIFNGNSHDYASQGQSQQVPNSKVYGTGSHFESGQMSFGSDDRRQFESLLFNNQRRDFDAVEEPFVPTADTNQLQSNMYQLFSSERNDLTNITLKNQIRQGIIDKFLDAGLQTWTHSFSAVEMAMLDLPLLDGINIIGVMPGKNRGQPNDGVVLIGAHYDTVQGSPGVNDNGSGMSMLLEIARLLKANRCKMTHSVMFVAFDLEEYGGVGSRHFIHEYLIPYELMNGKSHFQGAFILDTLLNFIPTMGSQDIPNDIYQNLPEWGNSIRRQGFVGDFVAMISRKETDSRLANHLKAGWMRAAASFSGPTLETSTSPGSSTSWPPYKLSDVAAKTLPASMPTVEILGSHANLLRSDHVMFWYHNSSEYKLTLNAILLTDTGPFRGYMRRCYHNQCDNNLAITKQNLAFMKFTTEAVATTVIDLTYTFCSGPEAVTGAQSSSLIATTSSKLLILVLGCLVLGLFTYK